MTQYIDKSALVAELEKRRGKNARNKLNLAASFEDNYLLSFLDTLEVKEVDLESNSFDATVCKIGNTYLKEMDKDAIVNALDSYKDGDKVKVIIIKEQNPTCSEEDEEMINKIVDFMMPMPIFFESTKGKSGKEYTKKFVKDATKWLKALKHQNTWNPSDEQMEALANALSLAKSCGEESAFDLRTLYEQLKKLKEE